MQHAILDLLRAALVPELGADITAGAAGNVQLVLVAIAALGALPHQLAVILHDLDLAVVAAALAVVGLGVQLGVHDVVVDELQHAHDGFQIVLHIGHFHIADGAARRHYVKLARAKGLKNSLVMSRHVIRNAFVPMAQQLPTNILMTISGSIYVESLFSIPGMGGLLVSAIQRQDNTLVQALVLMPVSQPPSFLHSARRPFPAAR